MKTSHKFKLFLAFIIVSGSIISCQQEKKVWKNPLQCEFSKQDGIIKTNYEYRYDIIPTVKLLGNGRIVNFEIYNYGNDLRINRSALNDVFSSSLAQISHYYVISPEDISIRNNLKDTVYGEWANGKVTVSEFNKIYEDVFITPLAYRQIQKPSSDSYFILVRLLSIDDNCYFNGLFVGDFRTESLINNHYDKVISSGGISFNANKSWPRWKPLFTDIEFQSYRSYQSLQSSGIDLGIKSPLEKLKDRLVR